MFSPPLSLPPPPLCFSLIWRVPRLSPRLFGDFLGPLPGGPGRHFRVPPLCFSLIWRVPRLSPRLFGLLAGGRGRHFRDFFETFRARRAREAPARGGLVPKKRSESAKICNFPENPYPQNFGGEDSLPKFGGWILENHLFYSDFWRPLPKFGG